MHGSTIPGHTATKRSSRRTHAIAATLFMLVGIACAFPAAPDDPARGAACTPSFTGCGMAHRVESMWPIPPGEPPYQQLADAAVQHLYGNGARIAPKPVDPRCFYYWVGFGDWSLEEAAWNKEWAGMWQPDVEYLLDGQYLVPESPDAEAGVQWPLPIDLMPEPTGSAPSGGETEIVGVTPLMVCQRLRHAAVGVVGPRWVHVVWITFEGERIDTVESTLYMDLDYT